MFLGFHGSPCDHRSSGACTRVVFMRYVSGLPRQPHSRPVTLCVTKRTVVTCVVWLVLFRMVFTSLFSGLPRQPVRPSIVRCLHRVMFMLPSSVRQNTSRLSHVTWASTAARGFCGSPHLVLWASTAAPSRSVLCACTIIEP